MPKTYEIIKKKLNGSDTDLAHVIAYCLALKGFSISEDSDFLLCNLEEV